MASYYFIRGEVDDKPTWIKKSGNPDDLGLVLLTTIQTPGSPIILDPATFQLGDIIEVTQHEPISLENCRPFEELLELIKNTPIKEFKPSAHYNSYFPGGMIEVLWKDDGYYVDYASDNSQLAYCRSFDTNEIVGIKIENIARLKVKSNPL